MGGRIEWVKGKMVGCGSFGSVHLAMNKSNGGLFVVKTSDSELGRDALKNEMNILNTLNNSSPYIVQCLGTENDHKDNKLEHVFMEYMAGGSLADVSNKFGGSLDEDVVRLYTKQILLGLYDLHKNGIVHCDLKCKNVLLASSGNIKLADFGCAKRVNKDDLKKPSSRCLNLTNGGGSPLWMAPEVLLNDDDDDDDARVVDFAADIWSLGCTVIEMATGRPPWADNLISISNPVGAMFKIARGDEIPQLPVHFSREGLDFLRRCLVRDPSKRPTAHELLNHPFIISNTLTYHKHYSASSPAAVLDVHQFEDTDTDTDDDDGEDYELQSPTGRLNCLFSIFTNEFVSPQGTTMWELEDGASRNHWITVRSRDQ